MGKRLGVDFGGQRRRCRIVSSAEAKRDRMSRCRRAFGNVTFMDSFLWLLNWLPATLPAIARLGNHRSMDRGTNTGEVRPLRIAPSAGPTS
jgi:hypothetical protein